MAVSPDSFPRVEDQGDAVDDQILRNSLFPVAKENHEWSNGKTQNHQDDAEEGRNSSEKNFWVMPAHRICPLPQ